MTPRVCALAALLLGGCLPPPAFPPSPGHIRDSVAPGPGSAAEPAAGGDIPPPVTLSPYLPPPRPGPKAPTYSVVVNEVPVKELLFALARDSGQNIDIHPAIQGLVTLNAINQTLPAILDRLQQQVNLRYRTDNGAIAVVPDTPYPRTYRVDYVNIARVTDSSIGVAAQIASTGAAPSDLSGAGGVTANTNAAGAGGIASGNSSNTTVRTRSDSDFWATLADNVGGLLEATGAVAASAEESAARREAERERRHRTVEQAQAVAGAGEGAPALFDTAFGATGGDGPTRPVVANPLAGTLTVLATERQHRSVREYLDRVLAAVSRQVLIEATIVEVNLRDAYKAGVDWSRLSVSGGLDIVQQTVAGNLSVNAPPSVTIGYVNPDSKVGDLSVVISLLQSFGDIRVLSSPKLMALNNQTALLKVVNNVVYFSIDVQQSTITTGGVVVPPTFATQAHTIPVGVVMSVTPQINANGEVILTVRPTISRVTGFKNDPNPALGTGATRIVNAVPEVEVREMESVLQVVSGQTVILGGLMQDEVNYRRDGVPGLSRLPGIGDAFSYRDEAANKTELVIFLRPTVIRQPSLAADALRPYAPYLPPATSPTRPPGVRP